MRKNWDQTWIYNEGVLCGHKWSSATAKGKFSMCKNYSYRYLCSFLLFVLFKCYDKNFFERMEIPTLQKERTLQKCYFGIKKVIYGEIFSKNDLTDWI